jgi:hypothetical protein
MMDSTAERLQAEREQQKKYSQERNEAAGGRNAAITFSMPFLILKLKNMY